MSLCFSLINALCISSQKNKQTQIKQSQQKRYENKAVSSRQTQKNEVYICKGKLTGMQALMATEQSNIVESVVQVAANAATAVVQAIAMTSIGNNQRAQNAGLNLGRTIMKEMTFIWGSTDKNQN